MTVQLSAYGEALSGAAKARYLEKLSLCELREDPYCIVASRLEAQPPVIPDVKWNDIHMYLYMISTPRQHRKEEIRVSSLRASSLAVDFEPNKLPVQHCLDCC